MINDENICWICKQKIGKSGSEHHLFNFFDYKMKMMQTFGDVKEMNLREDWKRLRPRVPSFKVHNKCHKELELKLRSGYCREVRREKITSF